MNRKHLYLDMTFISASISFVLTILVLEFIFGLSRADCPQIFSRKQWGARQAKSLTYQNIPVKYVIINHTVTSKCDAKFKCSAVLLGIQDYHLNDLQEDDIPYNFLIGDNGVYEGTGWHRMGAHTFGYNSNGIGIGFIGTFSEILPMVKALNDTQQLLQCGVEIGELDPNYILLGARQVIATDSPGLELYTEIQNWNHWNPTP